MPDRFFITGTDTGVGKTIASALLCASLDAMYWKPIQTGTVEGTDSDTVKKLSGIKHERVLPEGYRFAPPVSPHLAARLAGKKIRLAQIRIPEIARRGNLIVEGAGGVLVPINGAQFMTSLMKRLKLPVLLVARTALGTINHTLLSLAALRDARIDARGVIMSGEQNLENRKAVEKYGKVSVVGWIPPLRVLNRKSLLNVFRKHFDHEAFVR
jgi:dethiobiotin synthase